MREGERGDLASYAHPSQRGKGLLPYSAYAGMTYAELCMCVFRTGTGTVTALRCLCNNSEPHITPQCFRGNLACDSSLMCYAERFWNQDAQRYQSVWDCLDNVPDSGIPKLALCKINSTEKLYFCCNNSDFCNDVTLRLPGEVPVVVTESVSVLSASPSASPTASPTVPVKGEGRE